MKPDGSFCSSVSRPLFHQSLRARNLDLRPPSRQKAQRSRTPALQTRELPPHLFAVHDQVFAWVLQRLAENGLIERARIGADASAIEANVTLRAIVRRDTVEGYYREMLKRLAEEIGIEMPRAEDLIRLDRDRPGKKLSNEIWRAGPTRMRGSPR